jgi:hypothetical protein
MMGRCVCLVAPVLWGIAAFGQPRVSAVVCDQIHIPVEKLERAEKAAAHILRSAGIAVIWLDCAAGGGSGQQAMSNSFVLGLQNRPFGERTHLRRRGTMGRAVLPAGRAAIYYDAVQEFAQEVHADSEISSVLGGVIAHEFGHLLLGSEHSRSGIMRGSWGARELAMITMGNMVFSAAERERIQLALWAKTRDSGMSATSRPVSFLGNR